MHQSISTPWTALIAALSKAGFSQKALAERAGVDQSTICRLARGVGPEPRFSDGARLIGLAVSRGLIPREHCPYIEQFTEGAVTCEELRPDMAAYFALIRELAPAQRCRPESDALPDAAVGQGVAHG